MRINSSRKGKSCEREIVKILNDRFHDKLLEIPNEGVFSRSVGSGNRWSQKSKLSDEELNIFVSDITCPRSFKFCIESKSGYNEIDLLSLFGNGNKKLKTFLEQVKNDASLAGKKNPILVWKKNWQPRVVFIETRNCSKELLDSNTKLYFEDWVILPFDYFLSEDNSFFFF